jgi:hypothetical protein
MTTSQIIILSILFIIDFCLTIIVPVYGKITNPYLLSLGFVKMLFILMIIIIGTLFINEFKSKSKGKCPEFEQIQGPVYKIKNN